MVLHEFSENFFRFRGNVTGIQFSFNAKSYFFSTFLRNLVGPKSSWAWLNLQAVLYPVSYSRQGRAPLSQPLTLIPKNPQKPPPPGRIFAKCLEMCIRHCVSPPPSPVFSKTQRSPTLVGVYSIHT